MGQAVRAMKRPNITGTTSDATSQGEHRDEDEHEPADGRERAGGPHQPVRAGLIVAAIPNAPPPAFHVAPGIWPSLDVGRLSRTRSGGSGVATAPTAALVCPPGRLPHAALVDDRARAGQCYAADAGMAASTVRSRLARPRFETPNTTAQIPTSHTSAISPSPGEATSSAPNTIEATPPSTIQNSPSSSRGGRWPR